MGSHVKTKSAANIHRIREFELEKVNLAEEFDILQIVGEGWFGKILLVEHRATDTEMVLKALPKAYTALRDFYREFHYGLNLGAHKHIITTYDVAFETAGFYVFSQEYAPLGDLTSNVTENGIGELHTKRVAKQLTSALEHLHARELVHRDVKLDNILIFKSDFTRIKLCDFGETRRVGAIVRRRNEWLPYAPPEVLQIDTDDNYKTVTSHDVWQFGIVMFVCLTGCLPWQKAALDDPRYSRFQTWHSSALSPIRKQPKLFKLVSSRGQRLFRKLLEPKPERRPNTLTEVHRYLEDRWMAKTNIEKNSGADEDDGLCPSMYSFHSSPEEKNKLLHSLIQYGLETTVDREAKKDRIRAWIQNSVIEEEDEMSEDLSSRQTLDTSSSLITEEEEEENIVIHDNEHGPAGERMFNRGPVSTERLVTPTAPPRKHPKSTKHVPKVEKSYAPPIDPTVPLAKQKVHEASITKNNNSIRNPNAFLFENGSSGVLPQNSDSIYDNMKTNPVIIPSQPTETKNTSEPVTPVPQSPKLTRSELVSSAQKTIPKVEVMKQKHYKENLKKAFANTALVAVTGVSIRKSDSEMEDYVPPPEDPVPAVEPPKQEVSVPVPPEKRTLFSRTPKKTKQDHYMENMKKAFANTALLAVTGASVRKPESQKPAGRSLQQIPADFVFTEKEQDRNFEVYGISPPSLTNSVKRSTVVENGSGSSKSSNSSPQVDKKSAKNGNRHVTFSGGTAGGSSRSGSK